MKDEHGVDLKMLRKKNMDEKIWLRMFVFANAVLFRNGEDCLVMLTSFLK